MGANPYGLVRADTEETEIWLGFWHVPGIDADDTVCVTSARRIGGTGRATRAVVCTAEGRVRRSLKARSRTPDRDTAVAEVLQLAVDEVAPRAS